MSNFEKCLTNSHNNQEANKPDQNQENRPAESDQNKEKGHPDKINTGTRHPDHSVPENE